MATNPGTQGAREVWGDLGIAAGSNNIGSVSIVAGSANVGFVGRTRTSTGPAITTVTSTTASVSLSAANTSRIGWYVFNDSTSVLDVAYSSTASATVFTVEIAAGGFYEMPEPVYTGIVTGIWDASNGSARVTELV